MRLMRRVGVFARAVVILVALAPGGLTPVLGRASGIALLAALGEPPRYPSSMPPIGVTVLRDGLDPRGHWTQVLRLTIKSGGSLADASLVVYGDFDHVQPIFAAA